MASTSSAQATIGVGVAVGAPGRRAIAPDRIVLLTLALVALIGVHVAAQFQGVRQASALVFGDWLFTLALAVAILIYAAALGRKVARPLLGLDADSLGENLAALALGYGVISQGLLIAGFLRLYYAPVFALFALALTIWLRRELRAVLSRTYAGGVTMARTGLARIPSPGWCLLAIALLLILIPVAVRDTLPVTGDVPDWDGVAYHLSAPRLYVEAHRLIPVPDIQLANAPSGADIFAVIGYFAHTDTLDKTLNLLLGILFGAATFSFGKRRFGNAAGLCAVILLFTQFWVIELLPATVPDLTSAFFMVLGVSDACAWLAQPTQTHRAVDGLHAGSRRLPRAMVFVDPHQDRLLLRAGLLLGVSVSCKLTSAPAIPAICLAIGLTCLVRPGNGVTRRVVQAIWSGALLGIGACLPLALWLLKNAYFFGNPLYPQGVSATTADCTQTVSCTTLPAAHTSHLWWMASTFGREMWQYVSPLSVALLLAPLLLRRAPQRAAIAFVLIGAVLWLEFVPLFNPPRYWLGLVAVSEVLIAATLTEILRRLPMRAMVAELPLIGYLAIQSILALSIAVGLAQRSDAVALDTGSLSRYDYLAQRIRPYQAFAFVNEHLPSGVTVATVHTTLGYYLERPYLNDWYGARFAQLQGGQVARRAELAVWCSAGVRYAVFNRGANEYNVDSLAGIRPLSSFAWTHEPGLQPHVLFSARGVDVLALNPCAVARTMRR